MQKKALKLSACGPALRLGVEAVSFGFRPSGGRTEMTPYIVKVWGFRLDVHGAGKFR